KFNTAMVGIYRNNLIAAPGCEFIADVPGARKKVQHGNSFKVIAVVQDVEQGLLGHIRRRPNGKFFRCGNPFSLICSGACPHYRALRVVKSMVSQSCSTKREGSWEGTNIETFCMYL